MRRPMEHVGACLRSFLRGAHLERRVAEWSLVLEWPRLVGDQIAAHSEALDLHDGVLWVAVPSSNWRQHILFLKPTILKTLAREFPEIRVREIRCVARARALPRQRIETEQA